jgi:hypothetical protein
MSSSVSARKFGRFGKTLAAFGTPALVAGALAGFLVLGCSQGEGERCEINSDCRDGRCEIVNNFGICRATASTPTPDTAVTPTVDAGVPDTSTPRPDADAAGTGGGAGTDARDAAPESPAPVDATDAGDAPG